MKRFFLIFFLVLFLFSFVSAEVSSSTEAAFFIESKTTDDSAMSKNVDSYNYLWLTLIVILIVLGIYFFWKHKGRIVSKKNNTLHSKRKQKKSRRK